jgi:hypothetical protein
MIGDHGEPHFWYFGDLTEKTRKNIKGALIEKGITNKTV